MYLNEILQIDNFSNFSKQELLEIISILQNDLKYYNIKKEKQLNSLNTIINSLKHQIYELETKLKRQTEISSNYKKKLINKLSILERIKGKIDLSKS